MGYLGAKPPEGIYLFLSRVSTIYYFAFFLVIMPILSRIEKPSPMPIGISNPAIDNDVFDSGGGATGSPSYAMDSK